jgi:hypothetical protein
MQIGKLFLNNYFPNTNNSKYNKFSTALKQRTEQNVSFAGTICNDELVKRVKDLISYELPKNSTYNRAIVTAKKEVIKAILNGTRDWAGLIQKVEEAKSSKTHFTYSMSDLMRDLGFSKDRKADFYTFFSIKKQERGVFGYTEDFGTHLLNKLGLKNKSLQVFSISIDYLTGAKLIKRMDELIKADIIERIDYNAEAIKAKRLFIGELLNGTPEWQGVMERVKHNPGYGLQNLRKELGVPDKYYKSWQHLFDLNTHKKGDINYTEKLIMPILEKIGAADDLALQKFNLESERIFGEGLVKRVEDLIKTKIEDKKTNSNKGAIEAKKKLLEYLLDGTPKWPGIRDKVAKNPKYNLENLRIDLDVKDKNKDAWQAFFIQTWHTNGHIHYVERLVKPLIKKLGLGSESELKVYNQSRKS